MVVFESDNALTEYLRDRNPLYVRYGLPLWQAGFNSTYKLANAEVAALAQILAGQNQQTPTHSIHAANIRAHAMAGPKAPACKPPSPGPAALPHDRDSKDLGGDPKDLHGPGSGFIILHEGDPVRQRRVTTCLDLANQWARVVHRSEELAAANAQFTKCWDTKKTALQNLSMKLRPCTSEQGATAQGCFKDGALLVEAIARTLMGEGAAGHHAACFIKQPGTGGKRPDVAWCGLHKQDSVAQGDVYRFLTLALEYKSNMQDGSSMKDGFGQLIDRAGSVVDGRKLTGSACATLAGAVCDNVSIQPYLITSSHDPSEHSVSTTAAALPLVDAHGTVDTSLQGYQELVYLCWRAAEEELVQAAADSVTVCLEDGQRVAVRSGDGVEEDLVVVGRLGTPTASGCCYLARPVAGGAAAQQPVVLKVGPPPQLEQQARCLQLAPERWSQVEREVRVLGHLGPTPAQSLLPVMVSHGQLQLDVCCSSSAQCLQGAAALVTLLFGEALVQPDGVLPLLPPAEVEQLMWDLLQALAELQVRGAQHTDVHPRNIGRRLETASPRFYLYDFGFAVTEAEVAAGQQCCRPCSLHFSSLEVLTGEPPGPLADAQSLIFCGIARSGRQLPWQDVADTQQLWRCVGRRADFMQDPQLLPGWQKLFSPQLRQLCEGVFRAVLGGDTGEFKLAQQLLQAAK